MLEFDDILNKLESDKEIIRYKFTHSQIPIYFIIKSNIINKIISNQFELSNPHVDVKKYTLTDVMKYVYHTLKSNLFFAPKRDVYIFSSGIVNILENEKYVNKLYDKFDDLYGAKSQILESSTKRKYLTPKKKKIYYSELLNIIIALKSKFTKANKNDLNTIKEFIGFIEGRIDIKKDFLRELGQILIKVSKREKISIFIYKFFLKLKKPKLIVVEGGYYGDQYALIMAAKKLNIIVVEYQHGYVGMSYPAYNYLKNLYNDLSFFVPDYFLTFGRYWNDRIRIPAKIYEIGVPLIVEKTKRNLPLLKNGCKTILIISGGVDYKVINVFLKEILRKKSLDKYDIVLRLHPSEMPELQKRYGDILETRIELDTLSLYDVLSKVDIVVGFGVSTVQYEAVYFTDKVYLMNLPWVKFYEKDDKPTFLLFDNSDEFANMVESNCAIDIESKDMWEENWKTNYINFIEQTIGIKYDDNH